MSSSSGSNGAASITLTFEAGTDIDIAQTEVQNRLSTVEARLPEEVRRQVRELQDLDELKRLGKRLLVISSLDDLGLGIVEVRENARRAIDQDRVVAIEA